jgi:hypothetical protein
MSAVTMGYPKGGVEITLPDRVSAVVCAELVKFRQWQTLSLLTTSSVFEPAPFSCTVSTSVVVSRDGFTREIIVTETNRWIPEKLYEATSVK